MTLGADPLDNPIWAALSGPHRHFAEGTSGALRYLPSMTPFAALPDPSRPDAEALLTLLAPGQAAAFFTPQAITPPDGLSVIRTASLEQMVTHTLPTLAGPVEPLGSTDIPAMQALVDLAKPGPFGPRTQELGGFLGVWDGGELVAMAGERFRLPGHSEVTAVATHPDYRGRGLARRVVAAVMHAIAARGETPILHSFADNAAANTLYRALGMHTRRHMQLTVMRRPED